ncbi:integrase [Gossypium australe]|uniref:Integrase n=1 Tax=Gossypium australe TaxID=47621 RepID=A0A5B6WPT9_9ROSI|nr:integrase [Gossypium australe]
MHNDLKPLYWWPSMKREITKNMVKVEHQVSSGLLQPIFFLSENGSERLWILYHACLWVIVDRLTKLAHFIPVRTDYSLEKLYDVSSLDRWTIGASDLDTQRFVTLLCDLI